MPPLKSLPWFSIAHWIKSKFSIVAFRALGINLCLPCPAHLSPFSSHMELLIAPFTWNTFHPSVCRPHSAYLTGLRELLASLERFPWRPYGAPAASHSTVITNCCPVPCGRRSGQCLTLTPSAFTTTEFANRVLLWKPATPPEGFFSACPARIGQYTKSSCSWKRPSAKGGIKMESDYLNFLLLRISYLFLNPCLKACFWGNPTWDTGPSPSQTVSSAKLRTEVSRLSVGIRSACHIPGTEQINVFWLNGIQHSMNTYFIVGFLFKGKIETSKEHRLWSQKTWVQFKKWNPPLLMSGTLGVGAWWGKGYDYWLCSSSVQQESLGDSKRAS